MKHKLAATLVVVMALIAATAAVTGIAPAAQAANGPAWPIDTYGTPRATDNVVLKFRGIDDPTAASALAGLDILIPCNGLVDLPEGSYYIFQLVGLTVRTREGREVAK